MGKLYKIILAFLLLCSTVYADPLAIRIRTNISNFNNNLSSADVDVQKALDTLDNLNFNSIYLKLDGSNANTTIDIGSEDLTTTGVITAEQLTSTDDANITGTITAGDFVSSGGLDSRITLTRTIDNIVTGDGVSLIDTVIANSFSLGSGFYHKYIIDNADTAFLSGGNNFYADIDQNDTNANIFTDLTGFKSVISSVEGAIEAGVYGVDVRIGLDGKTPPQGISSSNVGVSAGIEGDSAETLYGAYFKATNNEITGNAYGFLGFGYNSESGSSTAINAVGVYGYGKSIGGVFASFLSQPQGADAKQYSFVSNSGHNHFNNGVSYFYTGASADGADNTTHITVASDAGSVYINKYLEVDNEAYFDAGMTIATGQNLTLGTTQWDNGSDKIDGEVIADDTIDDDSIDFSDVTCADLTMTDCGAITSSGVIDFSGASLEIPNGTNPTVDAEGEIAYDTDDENIRVYDGSTNRAINTIRIFYKTILNPDGVQSLEDAVMIFPVESEYAPFGIKLLSVGIKTDSSSTYSVNFEEWTSPSDGSPSTIETVATSSSYEAEDDGTLSDSDIAAGSIIYVDLPTTDIDMLQVWGTYYIKSGD